MGKANDLFFGVTEFRGATEKEDLEKGIDGWIGDVPVAVRKRRISVGQFNDISIRFDRKSGIDTELDKLLNGTFQPQLYLFFFQDALVVCGVETIKLCLQNKQYEIKDNMDEATTGCYIKLSSLKNRNFCIVPHKPLEAP